jgi:SAM-dependent methyltransferase
MHEGSMASLPIDERFDLVIVNFVFHWVDRSSLLQSIAEVDRVVADGGWLLIGDFLPAIPAKVPYHHLPDEPMYTYKQDYSEIFRASGGYRVVGLVTGNHARQARETDERNRIGTWLLRKQLDVLYPLVPLEA